MYELLAVIQFRQSRCRGRKNSLKMQETRTRLDYPSNRTTLMRQRDIRPGPFVTYSHLCRVVRRHRKDRTR